MSLCEERWGFNESDYLQPVSGCDTYIGRTCFRPSSKRVLRETAHHRRMRNLFGNQPLPEADRHTVRKKALVRGKHATPRTCRARGKQFVRSAGHDRCLHKVFGKEPLQAVKRDTGRNATLVPSEDASPCGEPVNTRRQLLAQNGHGGMSAVSPLIAPKRTWIIRR
jgi:hypothetical protein